MKLSEGVLSFSRDCKSIILKHKFVVEKSDNRVLLDGNKLINWSVFTLLHLHETKFHKRTNTDQLADDVN